MHEDLDPGLASVRGWLAATKRFWRRFERSSPRCQAPSVGFAQAARSCKP